MEVFLVGWMVGPMTRVGFITTSLNGAVSAISHAALGCQAAAQRVSVRDPGVSRIASLELARVWGTTHFSASVLPMK